MERERAKLSEEAKNDFFLFPQSFPRSFSMSYIPYTHRKRANTEGGKACCKGKATDTSSKGLKTSSTYPYLRNSPTSPSSPYVLNIWGKKIEMEGEKSRGEKTRYIYIYGVSESESKEK